MAPPRWFEQSQRERDPGHRKSSTSPLVRGVTGPTCAGISDSRSLRQAQGRPFAKYPKDGAPVVLEMPGKLRARATRPT